MRLLPLLPLMPDELTRNKHWAKIIRTLTEFGMQVEQSFSTGSNICTHEDCNYHNLNDIVPWKKYIYGLIDDVDLKDGEFIFKLGHKSPDGFVIEVERRINPSDLIVVLMEYIVKLSVKAELLEALK